MVPCGLVEVITVSMSQMTIAMFRVSFRSIYIRQSISVLWCPLPFPRKIDVRFGSCFIYFICIYFRILVSNTIPCGAGPAHPSGAPRLISGVHVVLSLVFYIIFYGSSFVLLWFFVLLLCCLSFDLRLLVTLVSSNCSHLSMWYSPSKKINRVST